MPYFIGVSGAILNSKLNHQKIFFIFFLLNEKIDLHLPHNYSNKLAQRKKEKRYVSSKFTYETLSRTR